MKSSKGKLTKFGKLVVKALTDQDMTKTQLAAEIGTSPQYLSYILYGVRSGEKYLPLIVATLNLDPNKVEKAIASITAEGRDRGAGSIYHAGRGGGA